MKTINGTFYYNDKKFNFSLDNYLVTILESDSFFIDDFHNIGILDSIAGNTTDGRSILLIQCDFGKNFLFSNTFSIQCFVITNNPVDFDFMINRISIYSPAINTFFPPKQAQHHFFNHKTGESTIKISPLKDTKLSFAYKNIECELNIERSITLTRTSNEIGSLITYFAFNFSNSLYASETTKYCLAFFDFFSFLNCNRSIPFDKIVLYAKGKTTKYERVAYAYIHIDKHNYKNTEFDSITIDDISPKNAGVLFNKIANLREHDNKIQLYFPKEKSDLYYINPAKWLLLSITFEGLFTESYPNFKSKIKPSFDEVKTQMLYKVNELSYNRGKKKEYFLKLKEQIENYNGLLSEKFNYVLNHNKDYLKNILSFNKIQHNITDKDNYGEIYSSYRNKLAHGDIQPFSPKEIAVARLLRPMIYLLLLNDINIPSESIIRIIQKLFR